MITELVKHECHDTVRSKVEPMETGMLDLILDDVVLGTEDLSWEGLPGADSILNALTWVMVLERLKIFSCNCVMSTVSILV